MTKQANTPIGSQIAPRANLSSTPRFPAVSGLSILFTSPRAPSVLLGERLGAVTVPELVA
jgi:hypothetical protein